ncbi:hypothetical protein QEP73_11900 [Pseudomonas defluvii]|nr:hypothetical protein QEP73_11900 [Pseudomonas defluvii]
MTVRIIDRDQKVLGTLQLPANTRLIDLETLRRFGAWRVEVAQ